MVGEERVVCRDPLGAQIGQRLQYTWVLEATQRDTF